MTQRERSYDLTPKRAMVLDYMRGNGKRLDAHGYEHLIRRGSFSERGLDRVIDDLRRLGYARGITRSFLLLTDDGLRASERFRCTA